MIDSLAVMRDGRINHPVRLDLEKWVGSQRETLNVGRFREFQDLNHPKNLVGVMRET